MGWNILNQKVLNWADDKGISAYSDPKTQCLKCVSEVGELADAVAKGRLYEVKDAIGDTLVTLVILSRMYDLTLEECLDAAYKVISSRTGNMINGVFVKDGS